VLSISTILSGVILQFYCPAAEFLADARGTLGFHGTLVENHYSLHHREMDIEQAELALVDG